MVPASTCMRRSRYSGQDRCRRKKGRSGDRCAVMFRAAFSAIENLFWRFGLDHMHLKRL